MGRRRRRLLFFSGGEAPPPPLPDQLLVMVGGQSNGQRIFTRGSPLASLVWAEELRSLLGYAAPNAFASYTSGSFVHNGSSSGATDWTVKIARGTVEGTALVDVSNPGLIAGGQYWWNTQDNTVATGNAEDVANSPGPLLRAFLVKVDAQSKLPDIIVFSGFEADTAWLFSGGAPARALEKAAWVSLVETIRDHIGAPVPFFLHALGTHDTNNTYQIAREIQHELPAAIDDFYIAAEQYDTSRAWAAEYTNSGTTDESPVITMASTSGWAANHGVVGPGIPAQARVASVQANVSITMDRDATATGTVTIKRKDIVHRYPGLTAIQPVDTPAMSPTTHNQDDGFYIICKRSARSVASYFGEDVAWRGPRLSSVSATASESTFEVTVEHDGGDDITVTDATGWAAFIDGSPLTITGLARLDATTIEVTVSAPLVAGTLVVWPAYQSMPHVIPANFVRDNASPNPMPLRSTSVSTVIA